VTAIASAASVLRHGIWPSRACWVIDTQIVGGRTVYGQLMQDLEIFDFEGRQEPSSAEQLHRALSRLFDGGNHFEIPAVGRTYPMLDLMVSGDLAVVHYFAAEGNARNGTNSDHAERHSLLIAGYGVPHFSSNSSNRASASASEAAV